MEAEESVGGRATGATRHGVVSLPSNIVEPLIALSIAWVGIENVWFHRMTLWRPLIVFGFGLLHGLGFADVLREMGLPRDEFLPGLVSFNVGVEIGQLTVIFGAWLLLHWFFKEPWYRKRIADPLSILIAAVGLTGPSSASFSSDATPATTVANSVSRASRVRHLRVRHLIRTSA